MGSGVERADGWSIPGVALAILVVIILGSVPAAVRLLRWRQCSPGEALWLVMSVESVVYLLAILTEYSFDRTLTPKGDRCFAFWFLPAASATAGYIIAMLGFLFRPRWAALFLGAVTTFAMISLDARGGHQHRAVEESFATALSPLGLAAAGLAAATLTILSPNDPTWRERLVPHCAGICMCFVPLLWFLFCWSAGLGFFRDPFLRVMD